MNIEGLTFFCTTNLIPIDIFFLTYLIYTVRLSICKSTYLASQCICLSSYCFLFPFEMAPKKEHEY